MSSREATEKFVKGSYYLLLDNVTNYGIGAVFWLVLAKITDPISIGQSMVVIAFATSIIGFSGYGIQITLAKYIAEYNARSMPQTARRVLIFGIKMALIISGGAALVLSLLSGPISTVAYQDSSLAVFLIFSILTFFPSQTLVYTLLGAFQGLHIMKYVVINDVVFQASRMAIAGVVMVFYGLDAFGILVSFSVASLFALIISYCVLLPRAIPKSNGKEETIQGVKHLVNFSGLNYLSIGLKTASAQIGMLVLGTQNFEWAAFFGLALLIAKVLGSFSISVSGALLPTASEQWTKGNKSELARMVNAAMRISLFVSGFGFIILMMEPAYFLKLISPSYVEAAFALQILIVFSIISAISTILASLLNGLNRAADVGKIGLFSSATAIMLTFILTPMLGLEGAATAMLIGAVLSLILSLIALKKEGKMITYTRSLFKPLTSMAAGLLIGYFFILWNNALIGIVLAVLTYAIFSIVYRVTTRNELKGLLGIVVRTMRR
jgi:stage V sporulation protein B